MHVSTYSLLVRAAPERRAPRGRALAAATMSRSQSSTHCGCASTHWAGGQVDMLIFFGTGRRVVGVRVTVANLRRRLLYLKFERLASDAHFTT